MFNALNRFISRLDDAPAQQQAEYGFQVLGNKNTELAIEPWFDFIVGINGRMIENSDPGLFSQEVRNCAGSSATLALWSAKGQRVRTLHVPIPSSAPGLGLTLQHTPLSVVSTIWHILEVSANSPADIAGLLPYSDFILGTPEGVLHGEAGLGELVEDHIGRPLRLYIYNNEYDVVRELVIHPSRDWGGEGALGCVLGYGALHRLPAPLSEPIEGPGETLFATEETGRFSNEEHRPTSSNGANLFVPAAIPAGQIAEPYVGSVPTTAASKLGAPSTPGPKKDRKHGHGHTVGKGQKTDMFMDDYFREGEKKSREVDFAPTTRAAIPPPPKAGEPPKSGTPQPETENTGDDD